MAILKIEERGTTGNRATLAVEGEIDLDTVGVLRQRLDDLQRRRVDRLVLDMAATRYVNSTALAVPVKYAEAFKPRGGGIALARAAPPPPPLSPILCPLPHRGFACRSHPCYRPCPGPWRYPLPQQPLLHRLR